MSYILPLQVIPILLDITRDLVYKTTLALLKGGDPLFADPVVNIELGGEERAVQRPHL